ncbi:ADP-forming succinate--CoA ligase subunit beta [Sulfobacillus thermosulfidooxidans]|uniref:ADP-forming succinate--CoA ligase subunit beta n=1 Tax=Sulfobacillus thermosulfidooxidans TaxID=28034 RepID=UPI00096B7258|nr:ADP-forming succinate--CoA ligase subunit beta [Sulfobacillus thermosulfidooxidans]OLZ09848.1 succinate--CoA ligase subunit beta [Sulfobacillus thermosulfidooxidans]OLZ15846.1 succinate--CoA ligase subunit beta [Sulfobacillus thermosulfidooxidans]OLZ18307.1 succinate--CoA ligase subunit beta [Sulfobacillus thermosulfidooxidans]
MKQYEYMAKGILAEHGIPIAPGRLVDSPEGAASAVRDLGPVALKAQVLVGGRGKAGGIRFAETPEQGAEIAKNMLGMVLKGYRVEKLYAEQKLPIEKELYISVTTDRNAKCPLVMASAAGGVEIEEVADDQIVKRYVDPAVGVLPYFGREMAEALGLKDVLFKEFADLVVKLYQIYREKDAELVEINPLAVVHGHLIAADARLNIDDSALYRHPDLTRVDEGSPLEKQVHEIGLAYVELDGDIAVMANGAGMAMATLDAIQYFGGRPANFLDAGGGASVEPTAKALGVLVSMKPKAILVNIFGGITRCDDVAKAILQVKSTVGIPVPLVVRLVGTNEKEGVALLNEAGIQAYSDMAEAAEQAVRLAKEAV